MKKALKITGIVIIALFALLLLLPFAFNGKINEAIKKQISNSLNVSVDFSSAGLSFIRNFPDATITLNDINIVGKDDFAADTLFNGRKLICTVNLKSIFTGSNYEVKSIKLSDAAIKLLVLENGKVNWDIMKPTETVDTTSESSSFKTALKSVRLSNVYFSYIDRESDIKFITDGVNASLSGDLTESKTNLDVEGSIEKLYTSYEGIPYLNNVHSEVKSLLDADIENFIFNFKESTVTLNDLKIIADGMFAMPDDGYDMDIRFKTGDNTFKSFLSLIPAIYAKDFDQLKASGTMSLAGFVKGKYTDSSIPAFDVKLNIADGSFSYPSMPQSVSSVNVAARFSNPDGVIDHTVSDISKLHLVMGSNPVDAAFEIKSPVSDPDINGWLKGKMNLADVSTFYPLEKNTQLRGNIDADITLAGKLSTIEKGNYEKFNAKGFALLNNVYYASPSTPDAVSVPSARLDFSPAFISVTGLKAAIGKSNLTADGKVENYLPYFLKSTCVLKGQLSVVSDFLDIDKLAGGSSAEASASDTSVMTTVLIPDNIDFALNSKLGRVVYGKYDITNFAGTVYVKNKVLSVQGVDFNMLGGKFIMAGKYSTVNEKNPDVDFDIKIAGVEVKDVYNTFVSMQKFAPIAAKLAGKINTNLKLQGALKDNMMPELASISGSGAIISALLGLSDVNTMQMIGDALKMDQFKKTSIENINLSFSLLNGLATVKPTDFKLGKYQANIGGTAGLDQTMNFVLNLNIPRADFGAQANSVLTNMVAEASKKGISYSPGEVIPVTVLIGGTFTDPKITVGLKQALSGVVDDLKQQAVEKLNEKKAEVIDKAKGEANKLIEQADAQAAKILDAAKKQSDQILQNAQLGADRAKHAADSAANKLVTEAAKKGPLAELAAKKAAEKVKQEGYKKADDILADARKKSDAVLAKAGTDAENVKKAAQSKVK